LRELEAFSEVSIAMIQQQHISISSLYCLPLSDCSQVKYLWAKQSNGEVTRLAPVSKMVFFLLNTSNRSLNQGVANVCGLGGSLSKQTCS